MVKCVSRPRRLYDLILDSIWPHLRGHPDSQPEDRDSFEAQPAEFLNEVERILASRLIQVEKRDHAVESKLIALLTLTSILSATVIVSLAAATALDKAKGIPSIFACVAVIIVLYVVVQLLCLLLATVSGLKRRSYRQLSRADITAKDSETSEEYRVRLLNLQVNYMYSNECEGEPEGQCDGCGSYRLEERINRDLRSHRACGRDRLRLSDGRGRNTTLSRGIAAVEVQALGFRRREPSGPARATGPGGRGIGRASLA